jgi:probable phosphoglycerate mutase
MNELLLIRHGESEHHLSGDSGGWTNALLTGHGRAQALTTAQYLTQRYPFQASAIISSDLTRAADTAAIIAQALGLRLETHSALRELNNGVAAGLAEDAAERLRNPFTEPALDWVPFPGGESWRAMYTRISMFLSSLRAEGRDRVVLVSHGNALICVINWFLGLDTDENLRYLMYEIRPCSLTHLRLTSDRSRTVVRLNDTEHLCPVALQRAAMMALSGYQASGSVHSAAPTIRGGRVE